MAMVFILREIFLIQRKISLVGRLTLPEEVSNEDTPLDLFALTAEPGDGPDIIRDHHERRPGQILLGCLTGSVLDVHLTETAGHDVSRQTESVVVTSVDILHWKCEGFIKPRVRLSLLMN